MLTIANKVKNEFDALIEGKTLIIWGTGYTAGYYTKKFNVEPKYYICNFADGTETFHGRRVYAPSILVNKEDNVLILIASMAYNEIAQNLENMGYRQPDNFINIESYFAELYENCYVREGNISPNFGHSLPNAEDLGDALLSVLGARKGDMDAWYEVKEIAHEEKAELFIELLYEAASTGLTSRNYTVAFNFASHIATKNIYSKKLGLRLTPPPLRCPYVYYSLLKELIDCCFSDYESKKFFLIYGSEAIPLSIYDLTCVYALLAQVELDSGYIESAFKFIQKAYDLSPYQLFVNHLYYEIGIAAKNLGIKLNTFFSFDNLSDYFCAVPFDSYSINEINFDTDTSASMLCTCGAHSQLEVESSDGWNSEERKKMRMSIHDGSFLYCNRFFCADIILKRLVKKADVTDERHKNIIDNKLTHITDIHCVRLNYDKSCNLKCSSCRSEFIINSTDRIDLLNRYAETNILPLLNTASSLCLSGTGEALSSPHSLWLLKRIKSAIYPGLKKIDLHTNAAHNLREAWDFMGDTSSLIHLVYVSIDGANKQTFEKLRYPARWNMLNKNMDFLKSLKITGKLSNLYVNFVVQKDNYTQMSDMLRLCISWNVDFLMFTRILMWRDDESFEEKNVFNSAHPLNDDLKKEIDRLKEEIARGLPLTVSIVGLMNTTGLK